MQATVKVGSLGFEPRQPVPKTGVLPLDDEPGTLNGGMSPSRAKAYSEYSNDVKPLPRSTLWRVGFQPFYDALIVGTTVA